MVYYGCEVTILSERQITQLQAAAIQAVWSPERNNRCCEVIFTILLPGHLTDPAQAIPHRRLTAKVRQDSSRCCNVTPTSATVLRGYAPPVAADKAAWVRSAWSEELTALGCIFDSTWGHFRTKVGPFWGDFGPFLG